MAMRRVAGFLFVVGLFASACSSSVEDAEVDVVQTTSTTTAPPVAEPDEADEADPASVEVTQPEAYLQVLEKTANLGGTLETPRGATWGSELSPSDLDAVAALGFTAVRLPIRFSDWSDRSAPYAIEAELVDEVNAYLDRAEALGIGIIVDMHHFDDMTNDPESNRERFVGLWRQIIVEFGDRDPSLVSFELLNEPHNELTPELWNVILDDAVAAIREEGSDHTLIFGPGSWNNLSVLDQLILPDDDNVIVTFHYYDPFDFTHQGADWVAGGMVDVRTSWAPDENGAGAALDADFAAAADWAAARDVHLFLGEFGVHTVAEREDRLAWTEFTRQTAEKYGMAWAIWDLTGDKFGMYDETTQTWDAEAVDALGLNPPS